MKKILVILLLFPILAQADLSEFKRACKDIGYKPKTEDFGSCVLKLKKKYEQRTNTNRVNTASNNNEYEELANKHFAAIQRQNDMLERQYQNQLRMYEAQQRRIEEEETRRRKAKGLKQLELGLRMLSGQSIGNASREMSGLQPLPEPNRPNYQPFERYQINLPNGSFMTCNYNTTFKKANCF
tara:strand:+ start:956 stop:1504 length:549 start_codon:yes stop_codon:yes gene_type:complete